MNTLECPLAGFAAGPKQPIIPGIHLVYSVDRQTASVGETLTFTAWIVNSTEEALTGVVLRARSLTNDHLDYLEYTEEPSLEELSGHTVGPRKTLHFTWSFTVEAQDGQSHGLLISALEAQLLSPSFGWLSSECDAYSTIVN